MSGAVIASTQAHIQPPNLRPGDSERQCKTCHFWSLWLPNTGDCMAYALKRQDAFIKSDDPEAFARDWPQLPARETWADAVCDEWEARER